MKEAAHRVRTRAGQWKTVAWILVGLAGIGSVWFAENASQTASLFGTGNDGGVFVASLIGAMVPALVVLLPYFMITHTLEGVADILEHVEPESSTRSRQSTPTAVETFLKGAPSPTSSTVPAQQDPSELSVGARRVAGMLGATGGATYKQVATRLSISIGDVDELINELQEAGLAVRDEGGVYRYVDPDESQPVGDASVHFCETCGWVVSEEEVTTSHAGHRIGRRKPV